jgi:hypothetical protein
LHVQARHAPWYRTAFPLHVSKALAASALQRPLCITFHRHTVMDSCSPYQEISPTLTELKYRLIFVACNNGLSTALVSSFKPRDSRFQTIFA